MNPSSSIALKNRQQASALIDQLVQQGVCDFCIAPGSRSTPFILAAAEHPKATTWVHYDERGLGFYAIGIALGKKRPVAILTTSGTAVANLLPAVMEAAHSFLPLILLTADRPPELRQCGANQTCDQVKIFQEWVKWQFDFPPPSEELSESFLRSQVAEAVFRSKEGPVHLNLMVREPLWDEAPIPYPIGKPIPIATPSFAFSEKIELSGKGLICIGRTTEDLSPILALAKRLSWPIFADLTSGIRAYPAAEEWIRHFQSISSPPEIDLILHFGDRFLAKKLPLAKERWHISSTPTFYDPGHQMTARFPLPAKTFCDAVIQCGDPSPGWLEAWQKLDHRVKTVQSALFPKALSTEPYLMNQLNHLLPNGWSCFFGTSMPVRDADRFFFPDNPTQVFANRGVSGIDGLIATSVGVAIGLNKPLFSLIGDQSCLHDLNSLPLLHQLKTPFVLAISNNFGSGIFSHLPIYGKTPYFETHLAAAHPFGFEEAAKMFHLPYYREDLQSAFALNRPCIVEIRTDRKTNQRVYLSLENKLAFA